jgi:hypothetical protein
MSVQDTLEGKSSLDLPLEVKEMWEEYLDSLFTHSKNPTESNKSQTRFWFYKVLDALKR